MLSRLCSLAVTLRREDDLLRPLVAHPEDLPNLTEVVPCVSKLERLDATKACFLEHRSVGRADRRPSFPHSHGTTVLPFFFFCNPLCFPFLYGPMRSWLPPRETFQEIQMATDQVTSSTLSKRVQADPAASYWLKAALQAAERRDVLDALSDAEALVLFCQHRARESGIKVAP